MSVVVFFIWVLFFWCLENDRRIISGVGAGLVLALCLFKPTLLALPALMLLSRPALASAGRIHSGRRAMALLSIATVGLEWLPGMVRGFGR